MTNNDSMSEESIMDIRLFGGVRMYHEDRELPLGTERYLKAFAALAANAPGQITREELADWIWDEPPNRAPEDLGRIMAGLRSALASVGRGHVLVSKNGLCRLDVPQRSVDVRRFTVLVQRAGGESDPARRSELLSEALALSDGIPLAGTRGRRIEAYRTDLLARLAEARLAVIGADIERGAGGRHALPMRQMFHEQPDDARIAGLAMLALYESGQRSVALRVFDDHYAHIRQTGLDVSPSVKQIQTKLLNSPDAVPLPIGALDRAPTSTEGIAMPHTEHPESAETDEETDTGAQPIFGRLVQHAGNINNVGHIHASTIHLGSRLVGSGADDDDE